MLWAVHIADGILAKPWLAGGFLLAAALVLLGAWRMRDEEIPLVALLTAAFFVGTLIHVSIGPTSVHLLLNGLVGVLLGRRAAVAIPIGLLLQAALLGHGGFTTLGINSCIMVLPALLASQLFIALRPLPFGRYPWLRVLLVTLVGGAALWSLAYVAGRFAPSLLPESFATHPVTLALIAVLALAGAIGERWLEPTPEFALGLLVGEVAVGVTLALNALVLAYGGEEDWTRLAQLVFLAHQPIAVVEPLVLGFTIGFLARVKPAMLGQPCPESVPCSIDSSV